MTGGFQPEQIDPGHMREGRENRKEAYIVIRYIDHLAKNYRYFPIRLNVWDNARHCWIFYSLRSVLERVRTKIIKTPVQDPRANGYCESCIGVIKKQCLNHFICLSLDQLDYINRQWLSYYNNERPHQGVDIGNKVLRPDFTPMSSGEIKREQRLGGIIFWYYREAA